MKYSYAAVSDVGKREINEDALEVRAGRGYLACALGDGLGGQGSGDFASKLATDVSIRRMSGFLPVGRRTLDACVREANRLIRDQQEEQHCRILTTLALLRERPKGFAIALWKPSQCTLLLLVFAVTCGYGGQCG